MNNSPTEVDAYTARINRLDQTAERDHAAIVAWNAQCEADMADPETLPADDMAIDERQEWFDYLDSLDAAEAQFEAELEYWEMYGSDR